MTMPTLLDISPSNLAILDERTAYEHFHGTTLEEAVTLFRRNEGLYADDLVWMGDAAFDFYVDAYVLHLRESPREAVDVSLAMHVVVTRSLLFRPTSKMNRLVDTIEQVGKPVEPRGQQLVGEYEAIKQSLRSTPIAK